MKQSLFAVYGANGCGRSVMPLAREQLIQAGISPERLVFVDDLPVAPICNGQRLIDFSSFLDQSRGAGQAVLAISNSVIRQKLAQRCQDKGIAAWSVRAANVIVMDDVEIGEGAILCPFVTLTSNIQIGKHFHANLYSYVEHDCVIGDFVTFAPGVKCNGNVVINNHAYIGAGAVIKQGQPGQPLVIGPGAVVGMGAVVTKDVSPGEVVVGNPARPLVKE